MALSSSSKRPARTGPGPRARGVLSWLLCGSTLLVTFSAAHPARAFDWEKMVMPGPLVSAHEEYEADCASCHKAFDVEAQRTLCLDCHELVAADIETHEGFHGRHPLASSGQCKLCHSEHLGRDADIRGLSDANFDHDTTDHPLLGAHQSTACASCHVADVARRDAPNDCIGCHRDDDAHNGALSEDCAKCHDETRWTTTRFDHDETDYPLTGAHEKAPCVGCHVGARYEDTPTTCVSCHAIDDAHDGRFGKDCASCHDTAGWAKKGFDHERESGFPLVGAHAKTACATCHRQPPGERELPEDCSGCHASEDVHAGRFGTTCDDCHDSTRWSPVVFKHGDRTGFSLMGAHAKVPCNDCHTGNDASLNEGATCITCHRADDVHQGTLGEDCAECHDENGFTARVRFDHDLTRFPLLGMHAVAPCESCHESHDFKRQSLNCVACHAVDDVHDRSLGLDCAMCHTPNGWEVWRFDHDKQTDFALHGAHEGLECSACHDRPAPDGIRLAHACVECHSDDDVHRGGFGRTCDSCHSDEAWKPARLGRRQRGRE